MIRLSFEVVCIGHFIRVPGRAKKYKRIDPAAMPDF